jgi:glucosamine kinase
MLLLCDSGSTKALWSNGSGGFYRTSGCNPRFLAQEDLEKLLRTELLPQLPTGPEAIDAVSFYGAGCATPEDCARVHDALRAVFPRASILVDSDLVGAALGLCGDRPGVICILGTGSNVARWDGARIVDALPSLGFALGDEGSGAELGKRLLKAYFYRELPDPLQQAFEADYPGLDRAGALASLYARPLPNRWCAEFALFYGKNRGAPWIEDQLSAEITTLVVRRILPLAPGELPVHATGSIAWYFSDVWKKCLSEKKLVLGQIKQTPLSL